MVNWIWLEHTVAIHADSWQELRETLSEHEKNWPNHQLRFSNADEKTDGGVVAIYWRPDFKWT